MNYKNTFIDFMHELAAINLEMVFSKTSDGKIGITNTNPEKSIFFELTADTVNFEFESNDLAFQNYSIFYNYFNVFNNEDKQKPENSEIAELDIKYSEPDEEGNKEAVTMLFNSNKRKSDSYIRLARKDIISRHAQKKIRMPSEDVTFSLTTEKMEEIKALTKMNSANKMKWEFKEDGEVRLTLINTRTENGFVEVFNVENPNKLAFTITTESSGFLLLPNGAFDVKVSEKGLFQYHMSRTDDIDISLYIAKDYQ